MAITESTHRSRNGFRYPREMPSFLKSSKTNRAKNRWVRVFQDDELLPQSKILKRQRARCESREERAEKRPNHGRDAGRRERSRLTRPDESIEGTGWKRAYGVASEALPEETGSNR